MALTRRSLEPSHIMRRHFGANLWRVRYRDRIARFFWNVGL